MNFLDNIVYIKKNEISELKSKHKPSYFKDLELFSKPALNFRSAISNKNKISVIAEIKKASPSKGILKTDFDHIKIAREYTENGANAISVLTDRQFFQGDIGYLEEISEFKKTPLLRKDFILDEIQILEAKSFGADAVLLIAEILSPKQIIELTLAAKEYGLAVLLELHSPAQLEKIDFGTNEIIGINNRDLSTFNVDLKTSIEISRLLPKYITKVSESGIHSKADIKVLKDSSFNAVLVGEHLMKSERIDSALKELISWCESES